MSCLSHPLYGLSPAVAHNPSVVPLWPKWLQCNGQIDPHNLARVVEPCAIFEKSDDKSRHRYSGAIQRVGERQARGRLWGRRGGRGRGRTMADVQTASLVVGAVGQGRDLTPAASSRHPRFDVILTIRAGAKLLSGHVENTSRYFCERDRHIAEEGDRRTGREARVRYKSRPARAASPPSPLHSGLPATRRTTPAS